MSWWFVPVIQDDIVLLIEVADSSFDQDRNRKGPLYARSGIPIYWIVDIPRRRVLAFENPGLEDYNTMTTYEAADQLAIQGGPTLAVSRFFGPATSASNS